MYNSNSLPFYPHSSSSLNATYSCNMRNGYVHANNFRSVLFACNTVNESKSHLTLDHHVISNRQLKETHDNDVNDNDDDNDVDDDDGLEENTQSQLQSVNCSMDFDEQIEKKLVKNSVDLFCYVCNYGFKSFPRLIRHMETKKHANQVEKFQSQDFQHFPICPHGSYNTFMPQHCHENDIKDIANEMELLPEDVINEMIATLGDDLNDKEKFFNNIESTELFNSLETV